MFIADIHTHTGSQADFIFFEHGISGLVKTMDSCGIDKIITADLDAMIHGHYEKSAEASNEHYEKSGGRILSYLIYNPNAIKTCLKVMENSVGNRPVFKGIKIHPSSHGCYADSELYEPAWAFAQQYHLPILSHTWALSSYNPSQRFSVPQRFVKYIEKYPSVKLVMGHSGGRYQGITEACAMAWKYENIYLDTAGDVYDPSLFEYMVKNAGGGKIMFGSDMNWFEPSCQIGMLLGADIPEADKARIFGGNAAELFDI